MNDTRRLIDAYHNDTTVHSILRNGGTLEDCVVELARQKRELIERVKQMELERPVVMEAAGT
jgi:hypothetical protein